jgi:hypothetical protein
MGLSTRKKRGRSEKRGGADPGRPGWVYKARINQHQAGRPARIMTKSDLTKVAFVALIAGGVVALLNRLAPDNKVRKFVENKA